jgi:uncharacterized Zn finger protein
MEVSPGSVTTEVQGSRVPLSGAHRNRRIREGAVDAGGARPCRNAWYTAALLAGEKPDYVEDIFAGLGLSPFPASARELSLDCSCPDQAMPCKHLAATF